MSEPSTPSRPAPRSLDDLIKELQRINLSQCLDRLYSDIGQLTDMERQLAHSQLTQATAGEPDSPLESWTGLYVRCPGPEPVDLALLDATSSVAGVVGDKKSSSGYSTDSASPPGLIGDIFCSCPPDAKWFNAHAELVCNCETEVKRFSACSDVLCGCESQFQPQHSHHADMNRPAASRTVPRFSSLWTGPLQQRTATTFRPAAASTPRPPATPHSPKTLRFAAAAEVMSPRDREQRPTAAAAAAVPPPQGILRRPAAVSPGGNERARRVAAALGRLEAELSAAAAANESHNSGGGARGTVQFVSGRRRLARTPLPPPMPCRPPAGGWDANGYYSADEPSSSVDAITPSSATQSTSATATEHQLQRRRRGVAAARRRLACLILSCGGRRRCRRTSPRSVIAPTATAAYLGPSDAGTLPSPATATAAAIVLYRCNLCQARFTQHVLVVAHVHERHVRVQMRPRYSCGLCPARFYASRFLRKHCARHHTAVVYGGVDKRTPQCLKTRRVV